MPLRPKDLDEQGVPIWFAGPGEVWVRCGPCSGKPLQGDRIPLDGRRYICAGKLFLRTGTILRAHFEIQTHTFDFLDRESVWCFVGDAWYQFGEPALWQVLGITREEAEPYTWSPDVPLDQHEPGPYPGNWYVPQE